MKLLTVVTIERRVVEEIHLELEECISINAFGEVLEEMSERATSGAYTVKRWHTVPRRNGGLFACGVWTYDTYPGDMAGKTTAECPIHGEELIEKMNVIEPEDVYRLRLGLGLQ